MIDSDQTSISSSREPIEAVIGYLRADDEVVRCAAAKALGALGDPAAAPALVAALLDSDPDVRTDAMEALITCARPDDAGAILKSLEGDPVKEVKVFAIQALARLDDRTSIPLIRRLAKDRAEDVVAWEDDAGMWDDWLDVQIAAIEALGHMQASEAIDDLLEARTDEMGQELDDVVFPALAGIEGGGLTALLGLLRDRDVRVRARAVKAMGEARPETLVPMRDLLLRDMSPAVRKLAIPAVDPKSDSASTLALHDPDTAVRRAALQAFATQRPDLLETALGDPEEDVRAIALGALVDGGHHRLPADLADNVQAWMTIAEAPLATVAAAVLPRLMGEQATPSLCRLAETAERPVEVRVAALKSLGQAADDGLIDSLLRCVVDPTCQIRAAALAALARLADRQDATCRTDAADLLAAAIRGDLGEGAKAHPPLAEQAGDLGASKVEADPGHVSITPDGDMVTRADNDDTVIEGHFPSSTLDAIQTTGMVLPSSGDGASTDHRKPAKRRVPIDGPVDVATDIRRVALTMAADCRNKQVEEALTGALSDSDPIVRSAAFRALAERSATIPPPDVNAIAEALEDPDAAIRHDAARILANAMADDAADRLSALLGDEDSIVRATAIGALGRGQPTAARDALHDASAMVRQVAMACVIAGGKASLLDDGIRICLAQGWVDTLIDGMKQSPAVRMQLLDGLAAGQLSRRERLTSLEALAAA